MLTTALRVYHWDRQAGSITPDRLEAEALAPLEPGLAVYRERIGQSRGRVRNAARRALEGLRPDRIEPMIKLLDDAATYAWPTTAKSAEQRVEVFVAAAARHPLLDPAAGTALLAGAFAPAPTDHAEAVERLYADYPEFHRLAAFPAGYTAADLRADYDLAQAQALLYSATRVTVEAGGDFKRILRYARLARLVYQVERLARHRYRFVLDGPSSILRQTRAYGVDFARFLAALVRLSDWRLQAEIELRRGWRPFTLTLSAADDLGQGRGALAAFDSSLEEAIAKKFGATRSGWTLAREGIVLDLGGGRLLVPDFVFQHEDGTEVVLEIVGYWTPEYLADKLGRLGAARGVNLVVAVPSHLAVRAGELPATVLPFKRRLLLRDLLPRLEAFRPGVSPPLADRGSTGSRASRATGRSASAPSPPRSDAGSRG
jgi:hypothetical protein